MQVGQGFVYPRLHECEANGDPKSPNPNSGFGFGIYGPILCFAARFAEDDKDQNNEQESDRVLKSWRVNEFFYLRFGDVSCLAD